MIYDLDDFDTITGAPAYKGRELWREGLSSKFKEAKMAVDLEELKRLLEKATPGAWGTFDEINDHCVSTPLDNGVFHYPSSDQPDTPDGRLTIALHNAAPALIEELEALRSLKPRSDMVCVPREPTEQEISDAEMAALEVMYPDETNLGSNPTFRRALKAARKAMLAAYEGKT